MNNMHVHVEFLVINFNSYDKKILSNIYHFLATHINPATHHRRPPEGVRVAPS